jgi:hypothetical protein
LNSFIRKSVRPFYDFLSAIGKTGLWFTVPMKGKAKLRFYSRKKCIDRNFDLNVAAFEKHKERIEREKGFIEDQNLYGDMKYGVSTMADSGCGVIAVYNALKVLGINESGSEGIPSLSNLISIFENSGITMAGQLGTGPKSIAAFFRKRGLAIETTYDQKRYEEIVRKSSVSIIIILNNRERLHDYVHTMCITKDEGRLVLHNSNGKRENYSSMRELMQGCGIKGKAQGIMLVGIKG